MARLLGIVRLSWVTGLAGRGAVLIVVVAASVGLPGYFAYRSAVRSQCELREHVTRAVLAAAAQAWDQGSKSAPRIDDDRRQPLGAWAGNVRWAAIVGADGRARELHRRTDLRSEDIVSQVPQDAGERTWQRLVVRGRYSENLYLLAFRSAQGAATLAAVIDVAAPPPARTRWLLAGAVAGLGLVLAALWFQRTIRRPLQRVGGAVAALHAGLRDATDSRNLPAELRELLGSAEEMRRELCRWRAQAGELRCRLDTQLEHRTRQMTRALHQATREADTDALTGLLNRRGLLRELPELFDRQRVARRELVAVLIDVDHLKPLNDTRGHQAGDAALAFLGDLIRSTIRKGTDLGVRYGGDEFLLLMPDTSAPDAIVAARRLRDLFGQRARTYGVDPVPGLSIGVAGCLQHRADSWQRLLRLGDAAMYHAKRHGLGVAAVHEIPLRSRGSAGQPR